MKNIVHFVSHEALEDLQEGLKVFGEVPESRKFLFDLFEYMKWDVRKDAAPLESVSKNAFRKLLRRALHAEKKSRRAAFRAGAGYSKRSLECS